MKFKSLLISCLVAFTSLHGATYTKKESPSYKYEDYKEVCKKALGRKKDVSYLLYKYIYMNYLTAQGELIKVNGYLFDYTATKKYQQEVYDNINYSKKYLNEHGGFNKDYGKLIDDLASVANLGLYVVTPTDEQGRTLYKTSEGNYLCEYEVTFELKKKLDFEGKYIKHTDMTVENLSNNDYNVLSNLMGRALTNHDNEEILHQDVLKRFFVIRCDYDACKYEAVPFKNRVQLVLTPENIKNNLNDFFYIP